MGSTSIWTSSIAYGTSYAYGYGSLSSSCNGKSPGKVVWKYHLPTSTRNAPPALAKQCQDGVSGGAREGQQAAVAIVSSRCIKKATECALTKICMYIMC